MKRLRVHPSPRPARAGLRGILAGLACAAGAGCASGTSGATDEAGVVADAPRLDAVESFADAAIDAGVVPDAYVPDAYVPDAFVVMVDAPPDACVPVDTQLLANPVFDLSPLGTGWQETRIDPGAPLVTGDDGVVEHSAPYKAWLGGFEAPTASVTDVLWQDVVVPATTTQLVLTGYYEVRTGETTTTSAFDTASLALTQTNGTPIQVVRSVSNLTATTAWTAISHTFTQNLAGQTVRLRMTSTNDFLNATSFYFDTLALTATHCP